MELVDKIKVSDRLGFVYEVTIKHHPGLGVSIAYHDEVRIAQREYGRMRPPTSDDDREWEEWESRFREWIDGPISDLEHDCKRHFDQSLSDRN